MKSVKPFSSNKFACDTKEAKLRAEIKQLRVEKLFMTADKIAEVPGAAMTPEEVEAEIRNQRAAKNAARA